MADEEIAYQPLDPRQLSLIRLRIIMTAVFVLFIVLMLDLGPLRDTPLPPVLAPALALLLAFAAILWMPGRRYRAWGYRLDEDELHIRGGLLFRFRTVVPFSRVQHIDVTQGPLERSFGLGRLVLHTAGTRTAAVWVPGLALEDAERMRDLIRSRIRQEPA